MTARWVFWTLEYMGYEHENEVEESSTIRYFVMEVAFLEVVSSDMQSYLFFGNLNLLLKWNEDILSRFPGQNEEVLVALSGGFSVRYFGRED